MVWGVSTVDANQMSRTPSPWSRTTAGFGMIVFLASDVMLFAGFFAAYFMLRSITEPWPPAGLDLHVARAALATAALVTSSFTLIIGERAYRDGDLRALRRWLLATVALGGAFLANQLLDYSTLPFGISTGVYGSAYWMLTGLHTIHVAVGLTALTMLFVRAARVRHVPGIAPSVSATSAFWHLVDVVWLFVFTTVWIIR